MDISLSLSLSLSHTHTQQRHWYVYYFYQVSQGYVYRGTCQLYFICNWIIIIMFKQFDCGLGSSELWNESNLQVRTGFPRKRCWGGSGSFACPLKNCNPTAFNLCFPQSTSKCTFDHISQQQSKSLCKFPCKILLKNKRKTALYKIKSHWHHFMNSFKHLIVGLWSLPWLSEGDLQKYGYFVPYWCAK